MSDQEFASVRTRVGIDTSTADSEPIACMMSNTVDPITAERIVKVTTTTGNLLLSFVIEAKPFEVFCIKNKMTAQTKHFRDGAWFWRPSDWTGEGVGPFRSEREAEDDAIHQSTRKTREDMR
jgi:hypothetical protein